MAKRDIGFSVVIAMDDTDGIGREGKLPWPHLRGDMAHFKRITTGADLGEANIGDANAVIMGRKTWDSLPVLYRPLRNRFNIVLTRDPHKFSLEPGSLGSYPVRSFDSALKVARTLCTGRILVIGGGQVYGEALNDPRCLLVHLTRVSGNFNCDTVVHLSTDHWVTVRGEQGGEEQGIKYSFTTLSKRHRDES